MAKNERKSQKNPYRFCIFIVSHAEAKCNSGVNNIFRHAAKMRLSAFFYGQPRSLMWECFGSYPAGSDAFIVAVHCFGELFARRFIERDDSAFGAPAVDAVHRAADKRRACELII